MHGRRKDPLAVLDDEASRLLTGYFAGSLGEEFPARSKGWDGMLLGSSMVRLADAVGFWWGRAVARRGRFRSRSWVLPVTGRAKSAGFGKIPKQGWANWLPVGTGSAALRARGPEAGDTQLCASQPAPAM